MAVASFTYNVLLVSIVIFLITLIYVGFYIYFNRNLKNDEPPTMNACPDYWKVDPNGNCIIPTNGTNMGSLDYELIPNIEYKLPNNVRIQNQNTITGEDVLENNTEYMLVGIPKIKEYYDGYKIKGYGISGNKVKYESDGSIKYNVCY